MSNLVMQKAFSSGEWAPELNARVDLAKYHSAAALLRNFFVDYRGGASTRPGTRYILQAYKSGSKVRLIPFQASFTVNYVLEFGDFYIRFYFQGAPVLEGAKAITAVSNANPGVFTSNAHGYSNGDWIFIQAINGLTLPNYSINGSYFIVQNATANTFTLTDLFGQAVNTIPFTAYISGGTAQRVYTLTSPFAAADLALVKFAQSVNSLILCHPSYAPQVLTLNSATNWTITAINFNPTLSTPVFNTFAVNGGGAPSTSYLYAVTAVDVNGQESAPLFIQAGPGNGISGSTPGTVEITWNAVAGAVGYNVYKAQYGYGGIGALPTTVSCGFIGFVTGTVFIDSNIAPDFAQGPPIIQNPFQGGSVAGLNLTGNANYTTVPALNIAAPSSGVQASGYVSLTVSAFTSSSIVVFNSTSPVGLTIAFNVGGVIGLITSATPGGGGSWNVTGISVVNGGSLTGVGVVATSPLTPVSVSGGATYSSGNAGVTWHIGSLVLSQGGSGYTSAPAVTFSSGGATATATLGATSAGNPAVPGFFDERLVLAGPNQAVQTFYMSQPGSPYNFNVSNPVQADDAITGSIVSGKLNAIKSMLSAPTGLIMFTSQQAWLVNGGANGASVTPIDVTATGHAYNGASDVPPIQINFDYLYVQAKGGIVRDLTFNFYTQIYTGTDISVLSSHLLFGHEILEWAYAEAPFSIVWAVREDGTLLSLTYVKEQELIGWAHSDTKGLFQSVTSVTEPAETLGVSANVDAVYVVVQRIINGQTLQYIERMADRYVPYGAEDCWALDSAVATVPHNGGIGTNALFQTASTATASAATGSGVIVNLSANIGLTNSNIGDIFRLGGGIATITAVNSGQQAVVTITKPITYVTPNDPNQTPLPDPNWTFWLPATTFTGIQNLTGQAVSALADGIPVTGLTVSATGSVTLPNPASKVIVGLPFTPQLQTLAIDVGDPTIQGKVKNIPFTNLRVSKTLGLSMGRNFSTLVTMKDLVLGAVNSTATGLPAAQQTITDLWTGDARTFMDSAFTTAGQYCIEQDQPYYATVLGTIPSLTVGDR